MNNVIELDNGTFVDVINSDKLVLVDFWATWCGPCRVLAPVLERLADKYVGDVIITKIEADKHREVAAQYQIRSIPTILFFKNGELLDKLVGASNENTIDDKIQMLK
jgi:thioredoxin 1